MKVQEIQIKDVEVTDNVRMGKVDKEIPRLMSSIHQDGLKQPIGVVPVGDKYRLIWGFRRLTACKKLGLKLIFAVIGEEEELKDQLIVNVIENIQRVNVIPAELGMLCLKLRKLKLSDEEIASRMCIPTQRVKNSVNIATHIPEYLHDKIRYFEAGGMNSDGAISSHLAKTVLRIGQDNSLSKQQIGELLEAAHEKSIAADQMSQIAQMVTQGMSLKEAIKEIENYHTIRVSITVSEKELEEKKKQYKLSNQSLMRLIAYGKIPGFKQPKFIKLEEK